MKDTYKFWILILSGFLTWMMTALLPDTGEGLSLLFMITIPLFIVLGIVFAFVYRFISKKIYDNDINDIIFGILLFFMIAFNFLAYPS
ncbi:hypothetical protein [uncultured Psychroserpens sp.]|uniref:hypothetical protein n=1 Tax=uncultured Psychroserpens sp. TaxID=255436 RepID=UPI002606BD03|nr:hypothetical protein [uncultured Psychroserpens sp.]